MKPADHPVVAVPTEMLCVVKEIQNDFLAFPLLDVSLLSFRLPETSSLATWMGTTTSTALSWGEFHSLLSLRESDGCSTLFYHFAAAAVAISKSQPTCTRGGGNKKGRNSS